MTHGEAVIWITYLSADIGKAEHRDLWHYEQTLDEIREMLEGEPERKTGKWKGYNANDKNWQRDDGSPIFLICSECENTVINNGSAHWCFCPNCGAKMEE